MPGLLKTLCWMTEGEATVMRTTIIDLDRVLCITSSVRDDGSSFVKLFVEKSTPLSCDIRSSDFIKILVEHKKNPEKDFDTHPCIPLDDDVSLFDDESSIEFHL